MRFLGGCDIYDSQSTDFWAESECNLWYVFYGAAKVNDRKNVVRIISRSIHQIPPKVIFFTDVIVRMNVLAQLSLVAQLTKIAKTQVHERPDRSWIRDRFFLVKKIHWNWSIRASVISINFLRVIYSKPVKTEERRGKPVNVRDRGGVYYKQWSEREEKSLKRVRKKRRERSIYLAFRKLSY